MKLMKPSILSSLSNLRFRHGTVQMNMTNHTKAHSIYSKSNIHIAMRLIGKMYIPKLMTAVRINNAYKAITISIIIHWIESGSSNCL